MSTLLSLAIRKSVKSARPQRSALASGRNGIHQSLRLRSSTAQRHSLLGKTRGTLLSKYPYLSLSTLSFDITLSSQEDFFIIPQTPVPLACSSATTTALSINERRFLNRVVQRIKTWIERLWETLCVTARSAEVAILLSPLCLLTPAAVLSSELGKSDEPTRLSNLAWWYTLHALQGLGPAFVKLAQWAATRRDIFPPNVCDRLSKLHDQGYTHSYKHSQQELSQAFGDDYEQKGLSIHENDIIGCGSAAQVYCGTLTTIVGDDKVQKKVAVKILHPRFPHLVERDLQFFKATADLLHALPIEKLKMLNLPRVVDNFGVILQRQADLRVEASNLIQFRDNFNGDEAEAGYIGMVSFPSPVEGWVDKSVLVEELVLDAQPIAEFLQDSSDQGWATRKELAGPLLRAFLKMVFIDNFCHCDLHPGTFLFLSFPSSSLFYANILTSRTLQAMFSLKRLKCLVRGGRAKRHGQSGRLSFLTQALRHHCHQATNAILKTCSELLS